MSKRQRNDRLRRIMTVAVIVLVGLALFSWTSVSRSNASFARQSSNPGNIFSTGSINLTNSKSGVAVITATNLMPGGTATGNLVIGITGDYTAAVTLTGSADNSALAQALTLRIEDITGTATTLYNAALSSFSSLSLGNMTSGTSKTYRFTITLNTAASSSAAASSTTKTLTFTGVAQ
jgi:hypothetical protein